MNLIRRINRDNCYLSSRSFENGSFMTGCKLATNAKFQLNISKVCLLGQQTQGHGGVNTTTVNPLSKYRDLLR